MTQIGRNSLTWVGFLQQLCIRAHRDYSVNAVSKRYRRALIRASLSSAAFDNIDKSASAESIRVWAEEEEHAKTERIRDVSVMDIYDIKMKKREFDRPTLVLIDKWFQSLLELKYFSN